MTTDDEAPLRVHLYMIDSRVFPERVLCRVPGHGPRIHVTEFGPQVTCPACRAIMRGLEPDETTGPPTS